MSRAGVFIGVDKTGALQRLRDAAAGAKRMYEWGIAQGINAKLITDTDGMKVYPDLIYDAIKEIIDGPGVDQLVLYFAGHGVNINRNEHWLLTDAPVNTSAAVNVSGSVELARYCGINHVVIFSDACRVAPEGLQAQSVRGVDVFPNDSASDKANPVDQFFACYLGRTAAEIKDPCTAANTYSALYTSALLDALNGLRRDVLERASDPNDSSFYVRPRNLEKYIEVEIPLRVKKMRLEGKVNQNPDAIITSDGNWLSRITQDRGARYPRDLKHESETSAPLLIPTPVSAPSFQTVAMNLVRTAARGDEHTLKWKLEAARMGEVAGVSHLVTMAEKLAVPFERDHFETECGIKVRGAKIVEFYSPRAKAELLGTEGDLLRVGSPRDPSIPAMSVLITFDRGVGSLIPVIGGFIATLTFDEGELVDVAYEPSANTSHWKKYKESATRLRVLRALAASSLQHGRFRLEQDDAIKIAEDMGCLRLVDPTLALYVAYANHDLQAIQCIRNMSSYLRRDIGVTFFDLALLSRQLLDKSVVVGDGIVPFVPLLSQGWALLDATRVRLPRALKGIERTMRDSLWSLFDETGLEKLKEAMHEGGVL